MLKHGRAIRCNSSLAYQLRQGYVGRSAAGFTLLSLTRELYTKLYYLYVIQEVTRQHLSIKAVSFKS